MALADKMAFFNPLAVKMICVVVLASAASQSMAQQGSQGTGVFINPDGHVVTNRHVIEGGAGRGFGLKSLVASAFAPTL